MADKKTTTPIISPGSTGGVTSAEQSKFLDLLQKLAKEQGVKIAPREEVVKPRKKEKVVVKPTDTIVVTDSGTKEEADVSVEKITSQPSSFKKMVVEDKKETRSTAKKAFDLLFPEMSELIKNIQIQSKKDKEEPRSLSRKTFDFLFPELARLIQSFEKKTEKTNKEFTKTETKNAVEINEVTDKLADANHILLSLNNEQHVTVSLLEKLLTEIKKSRSGEPDLSSILGDTSATVSAIGMGAIGGAVALATGGAMTALGLYKARNTPEGIAETKESFKRLDETAKSLRETPEATGDIPSPTSADVVDLTEDQAQSYIQSFGASADVSNKWMNSWRESKDIKSLDKDVVDIHDKLKPESFQLLKDIAKEQMSYGLLPESKKDISSMNEWKQNNNPITNVNRLNNQEIQPIISPNLQGDQSFLTPMIPSIPSTNNINEKTSDAVKSVNAPLTNMASVTNERVKSISPGTISNMQNTSIENINTDVTNLYRNSIENNNTSIQRNAETAVRVQDNEIPSIKQKTPVSMTKPSLSQKPSINRILQPTVSVTAESIKKTGNELLVKDENKNITIKANEIKFSTNDLNIEQDGKPIEEALKQRVPSIPSAPTAAPAPSSPSSGAAALEASVKNEQSVRENTTPRVSVTPVVQETTSHSPGLGSVQIPIDKNDPGNLEPPGSLERYAKLFDLAF